jgi:hypothetical protein
LAELQGQAVVEMPAEQTAGWAPRTEKVSALSPLPRPRSGN